MWRFANVTMALFLVSFAAAGDGPKRPPSKIEPVEAFDRLLKLAPDERMRLLAKVVDKDKDFTAVARGDWKETIIERGSLQAIQTSDLVCRIRASVPRSTIAATIKWVIDDGRAVKKGEIVIEFDDSPHVELLRAQKQVVSRANADQKRAADALERIKKENRIDVKLAQIDVRLAELTLQQYKGKDALQKETLALQVDRANLLVERLMLQGAPREEAANEDWNAKRNIHKGEVDRLRELEKDESNYVMTAPRDGIVVYHVLAQARPGPGSHQAIIAQGEPVREGQKLLAVVDLSKIAVTTKVHEAMIHKVRMGQKVSVRVDAFPKRTFTGKISEVATVASQADFFKNDVKAYAVKVALDGEHKDLRPAMSAEAAILVGDLKNALLVPATAVFGNAKQRYCFVLNGKDLDVRTIGIGASTGKSVEIKSGLQQGDLILTNPAAIVRRLENALPPNEK